MAGENEGAMEDPQGQMEVDPWAAAFAALEQKNEKDDKIGDESGKPDGESATNAENPDGNQDTGDVDDGEGQQASVVDGQPGVDTGGDPESDGESGEDSFGITEEFINEYQENLVDDIREQAINDVAKAFINKGIRHQNGVLGATIDDPDICKKDSDGIPTFYNPDTGREFTGDNPRRQAQEWVDDYNKELARVFNQTCENYEKQLVEREAPSLAVLEFASKYEELDPIRQGMFDNVIEDYEIKDDNGNVIGYSCDLDKALDLVNRQVEMIQGYVRENSKKEVPNAQPDQSGPVLDMKNSAGAVQTDANQPPKSLEEAMLRIQNDMLEKQRKQ